MPTRRPATALVVGGPYRFTRNSICAGMILVLLGIGTMVDSACMIVLALPFALVLRYGVIAREERYLEAKSGDAYRRYSARAALALTRRSPEVPGWVAIFRQTPSRKIEEPLASIHRFLGGTAKNEGTKKMLRLGYVIALSLALAAPAAAHGEYDWINKGGYRGVNGDHCCGKDDCYKLEASEVQQQKDGIHVPAYGVTVPYKEVQRSEDEHYWICRTSSRMRCFFAPHQGF